jgi:glycine/D-amino acid oxidase-like deaminating enzyme
MRFGYGADEIYTRMAMRSLAMWRSIEARLNQQLFQRTGVLRLSHDLDAYSVASKTTLARAGAPHEVVAPDELARRWPQMHQPVAGTYGLYEPESGVLMARRAVAAVAADAVTLGAEFALKAVAWPNPEIDAAVFAFACGPWLPKLFPEALGERIFPTRQEIFFFAPPAGDGRFAPPHLPAWTDFTDPRGPYSVPDIEGRGVKIGFDRHGEAFDPDTGSRMVSPDSVMRAQEFLGERFPALRRAALTEARVCQYENTSNGDFLIDRLPSDRNVWLIGGGSGHGFKHGPAVGEYAAARILGEGEEEPRFSLASKEEALTRTVY